jgi:hypothetical protein
MYNVALECAVPGGLGGCIVTFDRWAVSFLLALGAPLATGRGEAPAAGGPGLDPSTLLTETSGPQYVAQRSRSAKGPAGGQNTRLTPQWQDFEFEVDDDVAIRRQQPLPTFDDKGQPRKYTTAELKELKGPDASAPGYPADFTDLQPGRTVTLYLVQRNETLNRKAGRSDLASDDHPPSGGTSKPAKKSGQLTATVVHVDEKKKKLKIHVESLAIGQSGRYRLNAKDAGSALLADHRVSAIVIAAKKPSGK